MFDRHSIGGEHRGSHGERKTGKRNENKNKTIINNRTITNDKSMLERQESCSEIRVGVGLGARLSVPAYCSYKLAFGLQLGATDRAEC